jgi:uncharacterized protein YndB with AHSA1/START domain
MGSDSPAILGEATTTIQRPADSVFSFIADDFKTNYQRWSPEVVDLMILSTDDLDEDWLARQTRVDHGHKTTSTFRITDVERPTRIVFAGVSAAFECTYELQRTGADGQHTNLRFRFEIPRLELRMRPFRKLIQASVQEGAERTVHNLKGLIEQDVEPVTA